MSFVPGGGGSGGGGINQITAGLGITTNTVGASVAVATDLVAGNNITITNTSGDTLEISANGSTGITSVASSNGSGITATNTSGAVALTTNLVAGTGVSLTPSIVDTSITVASTGVATVASGNTGIAVGGTTQNPLILNTFSVSPGTGGITTTGTQFAKIINNTVDVSTAVGSGLTNGGKTGGDIPLSVNLTAGNAGIQIVPSTTTTGVAINNTGVLGITTGNAGITLGGTAQNPVLNATVASIVGGAGISTTNVGGTQTINNSGLLGLSAGNAGTNITITGTSTAPIINSSGGGATYTAGAGLNLIGNQFNNTGVLGLTQGANTSFLTGGGISITGTSTAPIISNTFTIVGNAGGSEGTTGCGLTIGAPNPGSGTRTQSLRVALAGANGISITPSTTPGNAIQTIGYTGLSGLTNANQGAGIAIGGTSANPSITNTGLLGLTSANQGTNVSITGTATAPIISAIATGVATVSAGTNITITGTAQNPVINSSGAGSIPTATFDNVSSILTLQPGGDTTSLAGYSQKFVSGTIGSVSGSGTNWTFTSTTLTFPRAGSYVCVYSYNIPTASWSFNNAMAYLVVTQASSQVVRQIYNIGTVSGSTFTTFGINNLGYEFKGALILPIGAFGSTNFNISATLYITGATQLNTSFAYQGSLSMYQQFITPLTSSTN